MKSILLSLIFVVSLVNEVQAQLDDYKYVVVPKTFDGFKRENQYKTSTLVKHLFTQKGFKTVYDDNLPEDLMINRCLGVYVNLDNQSSMFTTKTALVLKDCSDTKVFTTIQGRSKQKDYEPSFAEAIENAFRTSISSMPYNYTPSAQEASEPVTVSMKNDVKKLEEPSILNETIEPMVEPEVLAEQPKPKVVEQVATEEEQSFKSIAPEESSEYRIKDAAKSSSSSMMKTDIGVLYAQELPNGYQLVDSTPKIRMQLLKSTSPNVYIAESGTINGVVYTENGKWFFEYYNANELVTEELNIKF